MIVPENRRLQLNNEISNLKIKNNINKLEVERISRRILKDRFSAFEYGLYRIKEYETAYYKKKKRAKRDMSKYILFERAPKNNK